MNTEAETVKGEMPRYISHKKVWALKIKEIIKDISLAKEGSVRLAVEEEGYRPIKVNSNYVKKHNPQVGGYYIQYADGYESWSPASAFEEGYTLVPHNINEGGELSEDVELLNFGKALEALKDGKKVARKGWNGKGMWLRLVKNGCPSEKGNAGTIDFGEGEGNGCWAIDDFIGMKTADEKFVPWLASQTDVLAYDWCII